MAIGLLVYTLLTSTFVLRLDHAGVFDRLYLSGSQSISPMFEGPTRNLALPKEEVTTVAFVVTITGCEIHFQADEFMTADGAAVLAYTIRQNSIHGPNGGRYDYKLYALYHPSAAACALPLQKLGYIVQERDTPVAVSEIRNEKFRAHIQNWGCCGEKELIKFEAFTLTEYPIVVLLDIDTLILKPLDHLFDFLLDTKKLPDTEDLMYVGKPATKGWNTNVSVPHHLDMLFTVDYATVAPEVQVKPIQGGFNIIRPNITIRNEIMDIVREGDYRFDGTGWGGQTGPLFWGGTHGGKVFLFHGINPWTHNSLSPLVQRFNLSRLGSILLSNIVSRTLSGIELLHMERQQLSTEKVF